MIREITKRGCGNEFPFFGANYPDARCINGKLYDLDSYEDGLGLTIGGDEDCPICYTESYLDNCETEEEKQNFLEYRENLIKKWNIKIN